MKKNINKVRIAVIGLQFGGNFPPIYEDHPDVEYVGICDTDKQLLKIYGDYFSFKRRHSDIDEILNSDEYDAVHIVTPIHTHANLTMDVLNSGKHCACTVPMGTTIEELRAIIASQKKNEVNYMMMETAVYTYQFLNAKQMVKDGKIGHIQFLRGAHYQDMENWPSYWKGLPPMHYATHAISPLLALSNSRATKVHCYGSGIMREELIEEYGNPYPIETAIFRLDKNNICAEVTRSLFHTVRSYMESFNIYGDKASIEWQMEDEPPMLFELDEIDSKDRRGRQITHSKMGLLDFHEILPKEIIQSNKINLLNEKNSILPLIDGGAHHGSHPHMVNEFIRSIVEERSPCIDAVTAADWTAAGICAHESAMQGGVEITVPSFRS